MALAVLTGATVATGAETKKVEVVVQPVTLDYAGAKLCFSALTQSAAYFTALGQPKTVSPDGAAYMNAMQTGREAFGRIMVWEGRKAGMSRNEVEADVSRQKEAAIAFLRSGKPAMEYSIVLALHNEQAKNCLAFI